MYSFAFGMTFLSWAFAIFLLIGYLMIKMYEMSIEHMEDKIDSMTRIQIDAVLELYYSYDFSGKVYLTMLLGVSSFSAIIQIVKDSRNKED